MITANNLIIDLRLGQPLPEALLHELEKTARELRADFVAMTDKLSANFEDNPDWWASTPGSRNVISSPLFWHCCWIEMLRHKLPTTSSISVTVSSPALYHLLRQLPGGEGKVNLRAKRTSFLYLLWQAIKKPLVPLLAIRLNRPLPSPLKTNSGITLIDTFVSPNYVEKDRYYPGLASALSETDQNLIFFAPSFTDVPWRLYNDIIPRLRECKTRQFLIKEDYLKLSDLLYAFNHVSRRRMLRIPLTFFRDINITGLIKEEVASPDNLGAAFESLINLRFAKRLKQVGIRIRLTIDWFENQVIDKGWNAGFRKYYPEATTIGYQGMLVSDLWLHKYPTRIEARAKVIPEFIAAPGHMPTKMLHEFFPEALIETAPAFRFTGVYDIPKKMRDPQFFTILIGLPITINDSVDILKTVFSTLSRLTIHGLRIQIKLHPTVPKQHLMTAIKMAIPDSCAFIDGDFSEHIESADLLISSTSSVCIESLAKGVPVIVVASKIGLTYNPIPDSISKVFWRLCYSPDDICNAISFFHHNPPDQTKLADAVRRDFFEPVSMKGIEHLLRLSCPLDTTNEFQST